MKTNEDDFTNTTEAARLWDELDEIISRLRETAGEDRVTQLTDIVRDMVRAHGDLESRDGLAYELECWRTVQLIA